MADNQYPRQYWLELTAKSKALAKVDGHVAADGAVELKMKNAEQVRLLLRPELVPGGLLRIRINGKDQPPRQVLRDCNIFSEAAKSTADPWLAWTDAVEIELPK